MTYYFKDQWTISNKIWYKKCRKSVTNETIKRRAPNEIIPTKVLKY